MNLCWVLWVAHALAQKIIVRQQNHCKSVTCLTASLLYQDLKRCIISEWAALSHTVIDSAVRQWRQCLRTCIRAGGGHFEHTLK